MRWAAGVAVAGAAVGALVPATASAGPSSGAVPPVLSARIHVAGLYGVPEHATMVAVNVTAVSPAAPGHLVVYPCDEDIPATSNVNYTAGAVVPSFVLARIGGDGAICVATHATTDVVVDVLGYVPAGSAITPLPEAARAVDTREGPGGAAPVQAGGVRDVPIVGAIGVPEYSQFIVANVTAIGLDQPGYLTVFPCGGAVPATSSVNFRAAQVVANSVISRIGAAGAICVHASAAAHVIVDVFAAGAGGIETLDQPVRLVDTRTRGARQPANGQLRLDIAERADVPDNAAAAVYNLTSVGSTAAGHATSYPCDAAQPHTSNLNYSPSQIVANGTITPLSPSGELCIFNLSPTHLVVDLVGYTATNDHYVPVQPSRARDTRTDGEPKCDIGLFWNVSELSLFRKGAVAPVAIAAPPTTNVFQLASDCSFAYAAAGHDVWRVPLDGGPAHLYFTSPVYITDLFTLEDGGVLAGGNPPMSGVYEVVDLYTDEVLLRLDADWQDRLGITIDDYRLHAAIDMPWGTYVIDLDTLEFVSELPGIHGVLSPEGFYLAHTRRDGNNVVVEIVTIGGLPVDSFAVHAPPIYTTDHGRVRWASAGLLTINTHGPISLHWLRLFNGVVPGEFIPTGRPLVSIVPVYFDYR